MAARSRATTSRNTGSGVRDAINEFVGALPLGRLAQRLASAESAVARLQREVRKLGSAASSGSRRTSTSTTTRKAASTRKKSTATRKKSTAAGKKSSTARKPATSARAASSSTRTRTARKAATPATPRRRSTSRPRPEPAPLTAQPLTPPEPVSPFEAPPGLSSLPSSPLDEIASEELSVAASPVGPGPLPAP